MISTARMAVAVAAAALISTAAPAAAAAGIWTPVASGTTDEISAVDYVSGSQIVFTTTTGKIFMGAPGATAEVASFAGRTFFDVAMSPSGAVGLAVADSGKLFRFSAGTWSPVDLTNDSWNHECPFAPAGPYAPATPTANLLAVEWGSDAVAWVVSSAPGQVLRSSDSGNTWADASRQSDGDCQIDAEVTDVMPVPGSVADVYFADDYFGGLWRTADGLASTAQRRQEMVNCANVLFRGAVDPAAPNRVSIAGACDGSLHWGFSADAGTTDNYTDSAGPNIRDLAGAPGLFLAVGDAGKIEQTFDGRAVYQQPADADLATKDWRAVDLLDASTAVVGGVTGSLVVTTQASKAPDLLAPTTQITGPDQVAVGAATTYTAVATDNAGGSGVDPAGFQWTGTGLTPTTGATATYTFASPGTYTITARARDLTGNVGEPATKAVAVVAGALPKPTLPGASNPPLIGKVARVVGRFVVLRVKGRLGRPPGIAASAACNGTMSISVYKGKKRLTGKKAKVRSNCSYRKTIKVRRSRVGKAKRLKLKVAFKGNGVLAPLSSTYKVKVKR